VKLGAKAGIAVTLALHELATNAAKYGALSVDEGRIAISWSVDDRNLDLSWTEAGGPEANAPAPPGFGTMMIKRVLEAETRGQVDMAFERDGFRFRLVAPLQALSPGEDVASPARPSRRGFHFSR
jgi:two-component sensor histidine kinase